MSQLKAKRPTAANAVWPVRVMRRQDDITARVVQVHTHMSTYNLEDVQYGFPDLEVG